MKLISLSLYLLLTWQVNAEKKSLIAHGDKGVYEVELNKKTLGVLTRWEWNKQEFRGVSPGKAMKVADAYLSKISTDINWIPIKSSLELMGDKWVYIVRFFPDGEGWGNYSEIGVTLEGKVLQMKLKAPDKIKITRPKPHDKPRGSIEKKGNE